jgi:gas vesicle protein GvpA/GvpJ/GvpM family
VSGAQALYSSSQLQPRSTRQVTLVDLLDRLLAGGVVIHGHVTLAAADIDLVDLDLAVLLAATDKAAGR